MWRTLSHKKNNHEDEEHSRRRRNTRSHTHTNVINSGQTSSIWGKRTQFESNERNLVQNERNLVQNEHCVTHGRNLCLPNETLGHSRLRTRFVAQHGHTLATRTHNTNANLCCTERNAIMCCSQLWHNALHSEIIHIQLTYWSLLGKATSVCDFNRCYALNWCD